MRSILFIALFALVAFAPVKAGDDKDGSDKDGSTYSPTCTEVAEYNVIAIVQLEKVDDIGSTQKSLATSFAVALNLDDVNCVSVVGKEDNLFEVGIMSLNPEKTVNALIDLLPGEEYESYGKVILVTCAEVTGDVNKETTTVVPATLPTVLDVLVFIVADLEKFGAVQPTTQEMIDSICYANAEQCIEIIGFLTSLYSEAMYSQAKSVASVPAAGLSVGTVVGISIGCVAGTLLIALIALKVKTGSALPRSGRVSLTPSSSSSSSAALLGHRIDVRSAWSEAEI